MLETRRQKAERVAELLRYPRRPQRLEEGDDENVRAFFEEVGRVTPEGLEELYTRTFDLNPVATLEVGWHVWGEQYERGRFLADMRPLQDRHGIECDSELPDHLTVMLPLVASLDAVEAAPIAAHVETAIEKILVPLDEHGNPYRHLIRAARATLSGGCA